MKYNINFYFSSNTFDGLIIIFVLPIIFIVIYKVFKSFENIDSSDSNYNSNVDNEQQIEQETEQQVEYNEQTNEVSNGNLLNDFFYNRKEIEKEIDLHELNLSNEDDQKIRKFIECAFHYYNEKKYDIAEQLMLDTYNKIIEYGNENNRDLAVNKYFVYIGYINCIRRRREEVSEEFLEEIYLHGVKLFNDYQISQEKTPFKVIYCKVPPFNFLFTLYKKQKRYTDLIHLCDCAIEQKIKPSGKTNFHEYKNKFISLLNESNKTIS